MPVMLKRTINREDKGTSVIIQLFRIQAHVRDWRNAVVWHLLIYFLEWLQSKYWQPIRMRILYFAIKHCSPWLSKAIIIKQLEVKTQKAKICTINVSYWKAQALWTKVLHGYTASLCSPTLILHSILQGFRKLFQYQVSQIKANT